MGEFSIEKFEADCRENGDRFWYAHEFMKSLGYDSWTSFLRVITKAMASCARLGIDPTDAFLRSTCLDNGKEIAIRHFQRCRFSRHVQHESCYFDEAQIKPYCLQPFAHVCLIEAK